MIQLHLSKSKCLLFGGILFGTMLLPALSLKAQCLHHRRVPNLPPLTVPMWEVYGINPYTLTNRYSPHYIPFQQSIVGCPTCAGSAPADTEVYLGEVPASEVPADAIIEGQAPPVPESANPAGSEVEGVEPKENGKGN